jgi:hypothetical protein
MKFGHQGEFCRKRRFDFLEREAIGRIDNALQRQQVDLHRRADVRPQRFHEMARALDVAGQNAGHRLVEGGEDVAVSEILSLGEIFKGPLAIALRQSLVARPHRIATVFRILDGALDRPGLDLVEDELD